jgi:hypothetical protein
MDGITVGGRKLSDERQVANLAEAAKELAALVKSGHFSLDKPTSDRLQYLIARDEALEAGHFRGEGTLRVKALMTDSAPPAPLPASGPAGVRTGPARREPETLGTSGEEAHNRVGRRAVHGR